MKKESKRLLFKLLSGVTATSLIVAGVGIYINLEKDFSSSNNEETSNDGFIKNEGIDIKLVNEIRNEDGTITRTFTYSIQPESATNQSVEVSMEYDTGYPCDDVIEVNINENTKTINVTCLKPFSTPISLKVISLSNPDAVSSITLHYEKKVTKISPTKDEFVTYGEDFTTFDQSLLYNVDYSIYTIDKDYSFKIELVDVCYDDGFDAWPDLKNAFLNEVENMINNESLWTADTWWNLDDRLEWRESLLDFTEEDFASAEITYNVICIETGQKINNISTAIGIPLGMDYSNHEIKVNTINLSSSTLIF